MTGSQRGKGSVIVSSNFLKRKLLLTFFGLLNRNNLFICLFFTEISFFLFLGLLGREGIFRIMKVIDFKNIFTSTFSDSQKKWMCYKLMFISVCVASIT